jgi:Fanconi-associated nuclease 1
MIDHAAGQHTLPSLAKDKGKSKAKLARKHDGLTQTQLSFGQKPKDISQLERLREMALRKLGKLFYHPPGRKSHDS